jgi:hypothetical protein
MTDQEVIEYIKAHLRDYDKAFGSNSTLIGFWVENNPELEAWAKEVVEANTGKKFTKTFLDDLAEPAEESISESFEEAYEELNKTWED